jgi:hypothetical protein
VLILGLVFLGREGLTMGKVAEMTDEPPDPPEEPPDSPGSSAYVAAIPAVEASFR